LIEKPRREHDPNEEARGTMKLVHLKLMQSAEKTNLSKNPSMNRCELGVKFGDWFLGGVDQMKILGDRGSLQSKASMEQRRTLVVETRFGSQEDFSNEIKE